MTGPGGQRKLGDSAGVGKTVLAGTTGLGQPPEQADPS